MAGDEPTKGAPKKDTKSGTIKLKKAAPKHKQPGNWRDGGIIDETKSKGSPASTATSPGPVVNQLDENARETFATGRPLEDSPDLQQCKHCKKSVLKTAAKAHIAQCLRVKKEKAQRKKEAREARERAKEAAREEEARKNDDNDDDDDDEDGDGDSKGKAGKKAAGKKPDEKGKKRKADGTLEGPKSKKKKDEPKAKAPKTKGPVDVERQCGVILPNGQACARSLTCKSHSMGAKRAVPGRSLPYDMLLAAYQKKNQAKQQKAALDATAPLEDDDDADNGPVDSDEETAAVMTSLAKWRPQPVVPQPVFQPIRRQYQHQRLHEQLAVATNGGRTNIFAVRNYQRPATATIIPEMQMLPQQPPPPPLQQQQQFQPMMLDGEDAPGEMDIGMINFTNPTGPPVPSSRQASVTSRG